ncbi:hypothetical protein [Oscillatoria acuminata]|nr:hypothetical protein [Oscillatoria acuminata]
MQLGILVMRLQSDSRVRVEEKGVQGRSLLYPQPLSLQKLKMF